MSNNRAGERKGVERQTLFLSQKGEKILRQYREISPERPCDGIIILGYHLLLPAGIPFALHLSEMNESRWNAKAQGLPLLL